MVQSCIEGVRKPDSAIYRLTLERLGVEPSEAVFLDDIGSNLKTAREMGIHTIKVTLMYMYGEGAGLLHMHEYM